MGNANLTDQQKGCLGCVGVIVIPFLALLAWGAIMDQQNNAKIAQEMKGQPAISVLPSQILADATGSEFDGKVVQVRGAVKDMSADKFGCIVFLGSPVGKDGIYCNFGPEWWTNIRKWRKGDSMNVRGVVSSGLGVPTMDRCQIDPSTQ